MGVWDVMVRSLLGGSRPLRGEMSGLFCRGEDESTIKYSYIMLESLCFMCVHL
jgi:hypothetical protein